MAKLLNARFHLKPRFCYLFRHVVKVQEHHKATVKTILWISTFLLSINNIYTVYTALYDTNNQIYDDIQNMHKLKTSNK